MKILTKFLIYPYWNVNARIVNNQVFYTEFLIYPYWNVNVIGMLGATPFCLVSNLSILECKSINESFINNSFFVSNLSILECKYDFCSTNVGEDLCF